MNRKEKAEGIVIFLTIFYIGSINQKAANNIILDINFIHELLGFVGITAIGMFLGSSFYIKHNQQERDSDRLVVPPEKIEGLNLTQLFYCAERLHNYPASIDCLRTIRSYRVLSYFGGVLTLASIGIALLYLMSEIGLSNNPSYILGAVLIFISEGAIVDMTKSIYDAITSFVGSGRIEDSVVKRDFWETLKYSLRDFSLGIGFVALAGFSIVTIDIFIKYSSHIMVLRGVHYLIVFAALTSGIGWTGAAIYQVAPHISEKYADREIPDMNEAFFQEVAYEEDGTILLEKLEVMDESSE